MMEAAKIARDKRLRRAILRTLNNARPSPVSGEMLRDCMESLPAWSDAVRELPVDIDADKKLMQLCQDLIGYQLAACVDRRTHKNQHEGLEWMAYSITAKGTGLIDEVEPPHPLVEDGRIGK